VRDIVIGMSDGLTVPFALAAGLSGAVAASGIIVTAGLAEIAAGSIAMGLGGYLAASSDAEHYASERVREQREIQEKAGAEADEVRVVLQSYGLTAEESAPIVAALRQRPETWVDFVMRFELGLEAPDPKRALTSALTIAGAYVAVASSPWPPTSLAGGCAPLRAIQGGTALGVPRTIDGLRPSGQRPGCLPRYSSPYFCVTLTSIRRFCCRPSVVALSAVGCCSP
jgi:VIT family protein